MASRWLSLALILAIPASASAETLREQSQRSVEIPGITRVLAQNARGRIEVRSTSDRSLRVTALKIVRAMSNRAARRLADETVVELGREGSTYEIRVRYPHVSSHINLWQGMSDMSMIPTPARKFDACAPPMPPAVMSPPTARPARPSAHRARRRCGFGGSGRLRMALTSNGSSPSFFSFFDARSASHSCP